MKKKNNLFKNIFYIFFAFCFFSVGFMTLNIQNENTAMAEDVSNSVLTNDQLPDYFSADEYLLHPVQRQVARETIPCNHDKMTRIVKAQLGNDAGMIGAALLGKKKRII